MEPKELVALRPPNKSIDSLFPFQSPNVVERKDNNNDSMPFGQPSQHLKTVVEAILVRGSLLADDKVTRALKTGFQAELLGSGLDYGLLGSVVQDTVAELKVQLESSEMTHGEKVLLWMLTQKDTAKDKAHQRSHLCELLVFLAETASQQQGQDKILQCTKDFTLFLLRNVLTSARTESALKYSRLLESLGMSRLAVDRKADPDLYRTKAKIAIVARIVGNNSMKSVVTLYDGKLKAFTSQVTPEERRKNSKILPKRAQTQRVDALWATDDFCDEEMDVNNEVAFFVSGLPPTIKAEVPPSVKADASVGTATTQGMTTSTTLDSVARAKVISNFNRMEVCAGKKGELTFNDVRDMCSFFLDPRSKAALGIDASAFVPVDLSAEVDPLALGSASPSSERDISPLTVGSEVEHQEGITVTDEGLRHSFQCLYALRKDRECQKHLKFLEKDDSVPESWCSGELESDIDPALTGQKWKIEDFDIMGIIGGGNFGRVLDLRSKHLMCMRVCGKIEFFSFFEYSTSFRGELLESTKVKHPNIARIVGYFVIPWLGDHHKPICMCILQEKGRYNLREIVVELNGCSSEELAPADKLRKVCSIMIQILSAVGALEDAHVLHRDIKPENIVYFKDNLWKLVDFGLARVYDAEGTLTEDAGTSKYIPPERKGPKHDSFSSGIVMYELMCGKCPSEKVPSKEELAEAFKIQGIAEEPAQQAFDLCEGLTLFSEKERWTGKDALGVARKLLEKLVDADGDENVGSIETETLSKA